MKINIGSYVYNKISKFTGYVTLMEKFGDHIRVKITTTNGKSLDDHIDNFEICKKCINKSCQNHEHQGTFIDELCAPCYEYLAKGEYDKLDRNKPAGHMIGTADYSWTCEDGKLTICVNGDKIKSVNLITEYK